MAQYEVGVWQEQYGRVVVWLPDGVEPGSNEAKEMVNKYLEDNALQPDSGVNVTESTGWFIDEQPEWCPV